MKNFINVSVRSGADALIGDTIWGLQLSRVFQILTRDSLISFIWSCGRGRGNERFFLNKLPCLKASMLAFLANKLCQGETLLNVDDAPGCVLRL